MGHLPSYIMAQDKLRSVDIILTTYSTLVLHFQHKKLGKSENIFYEIEFFRIVLDEGKERHNKSSLVSD
jgi:SNF2 family DNA or RNA helicase